MTEKANGDITTVVPSNTQLSYVLSITVPQPTIRIRIPKLLARAMQRRSHDDCESAENGSCRKYWGSRKNASKKVGSIFSVFRSKKSASSEIADCSDGENGELKQTGDDQKNNKVKKTRKRIESDSSEPEMVLTTRLGVSRSIGLKEDEGKEQKPTGRVKKSVTFEIYEKLKKAAGGDGTVNRKTRFGNLFAGKRQGPRRVRTRSRNLSVKQEITNKDEISKVGSKVLEMMPNKDDIPKVASKAWTNLNLNLNRKPNLRRKLKVGQSMKRIPGLEEKQELCKKRILMGEKCRPLGSIKYDENGIMLPGPIP